MNNYKDCEHRLRRGEPVPGSSPAGLDATGKRCRLMKGFCPRERPVECRRYEPTGRCCPECGAEEGHEDHCSSGPFLGRLERFDAFEVLPIAACADERGGFLTRPDGKPIMEACEPGDPGAVMWCVFGRSDERGLEGVADCDDEGTAMAVKVLLDCYLRDRAAGQEKEET